MTVGDDWGVVCVERMRVGIVLCRDEVQDQALRAVEAHQRVRAAQRVVQVRVGADRTHVLSLAFDVLEVG